MQSDEQAIRDVIATWLRASSANDVNALASLMDEDVVFLTPGQAPIRGRDNFLAIQMQVLGQVRIEAASDIQEVRVAGDWGFCWTHLTVKVTPANSGSPMQRSGHILSVFRKKPDGTWVLYRDANLLAGPSAPTPAQA
jgi:uncharacterized protein (TIGR02246 family)